ncbi:G-protein coupled receptor GRL101-like protein [Trichoplax sp. H2]|nr:G-protein coupled receptor GRL101-like protein [Trichoplax sp. H2]|eukprot:RDD38952.1 G-protein coupled receptor GRL101-like protein [Trichoplax sp. H2]
MDNISDLNNSYRPPLHMNFKFLIPILMIISVVAIFSNFYNLIIIYRKPGLRDFRKSFLTYLNITDLCTGIVTIPCLIIALWYQDGDAVCQVQGFFASFCTGMATFLSCAIALDRCYAVTYPYQYLASVDSRRNNIAIITACIISIIFALLPSLPKPLTGLGKYRIQNLCWISLTVSNENYITITMAAINAIVTIVVFISSYSITFYTAYIKSRSNFASYGSIKKSIRTTSLIVGTNGICWLPVMISGTISAVHFLLYNKIYKISIYVQVIALTLVYLNAATNPLIYAGTNEILRKEYKKLILKLHSNIMSVCHNQAVISFLPNRETSRVITINIKENSLPM